MKSDAARWQDQAYTAQPVTVRQHVTPPAERCHGLVSHSYSTLRLCTDGHSTFEQQGQWALRAGDVAILPAGAAHRVRSALGERSYCVAVSPSCLLARDQAHLLEPFERVRRGGAAVVSLPASRQSFVHGLLAELERELARADAGSLHVRDSLLTLLVTEVARASESLQTTLRDDVVSESLRFIEQNCLGPLSLSDVARAVQRSPAHLTTLLKRATGLTANGWIAMGRMAEARRRLAHSDERIEVIAERVGYADSTHFGRVFRGIHGVTPRAFRSRSGA